MQNWSSRDYARSEKSFPMTGPALADQTGCHGSAARCCVSSSTYVVGANDWTAIAAGRGRYTRQCVRPCAVRLCRASPPPALPQPPPDRHSRDSPTFRRLCFPFFLFEPLLRSSPPSTPPPRFRTLSAAMAAYILAKIPISKKNLGR